MAYHNAAHQKLPRLDSPEEDFTSYKGLVTKAPAQHTAMIRNIHGYRPTTPVVELAFPCIICGIWIGISFTLVGLSSTIVLAVFSAIVNSRIFPDIQAMHQIASSNDRTFKMAMGLYILSVAALFMQQGGRLAFEDCWWACMQVFFGVQMVFFLSLVAIWMVPQIIKIMGWVCGAVAWVWRHLVGGEEDMADDEREYVRPKPRLNEKLAKRRHRGWEDWSD